MKADQLCSSELQTPDFKDVIPKVMEALSKRRMKEIFYKKLELSPSLVSHWKSGRRIPTIEQEEHFMTVALDVISQFDASKKNSILNMGVMIDKLDYLIAN